MHSKIFFVIPEKAALFLLGHLPFRRI